MRIIKNIYLTVYTLFFRVAGDSWTPAINACKAIVGVTLIQWALLVVISAWAQWWWGVKLLLGFNTWIINVLLFSSFGLNYYFLVGRGHGEEYGRELASLDKRQRRWRYAVGITATAIIMGFLIASFYLANPHRR
jgi:hypothetical protein